MEISPNCSLCKGGCCEGDVALYGLMRSDLIKLAARNLVIYYPAGTYPNIRTMYADLRSNGAEAGIYALENYPNDVDGVRIGTCKELENGICLIHDDIPSPCRRMELGGKACLNIFIKKMLEMENCNHDQELK
jgi:hypothetical protein